MNVLSTKLLDNHITEIARQQFGFTLLCKSFTRITKADFICSPMTVDYYDSIVFTSANAVRIFLSEMDPEILRNKNIFSLQGATREELANHNLIPVAIAPDAETLGNLIKLRQAELDILRVLHPTGDLTLPHLKTAATGQGLEYQHVTVYNTCLHPVPVDGTLVDAVLFFSPSAVDSFSMANRFLEQRYYVCIGSTTYKRLWDYTHTNNILVADHPTPEAMLMKLFKMARHDKK